MFISQTRLLRTAQLNANQTVTQFTPPQQIARYPGIVRNIENAFLALPQNQRPAEAQKGGYELRYDARFVAVPTIAGTHSGASNLLVVHYRAWPSEADRQANPTNPPYHNTHTMGIDPGLSAVDLRTAVLAEIERTLIRHSIDNRLGDQRDANLVATQTDPTGVLNKAQPLDGQLQAVDRTDTTAPQRTNLEA